MRVPWTTRRSNQSILKEISPEKLLESEVNDGIKEEVEARNVISVPESVFKNPRSGATPNLKKNVFIYSCGGSSFEDFL